MTPLIPILTLFAMLPAAGGCAAQKPESRPPASPALAVRWSKDLKLPSVGSIAAEMAKPFPEPFPVAGPGGAKGVARNCATALERLAKGFSPASDADARALQFASVRCLALRAVGRAVPAKRSYLGGFRLDENALALLPPSVGLAVSRDEVKAVREAEAAGKSWAEFAGPGVQAAVDPPAGDRTEPVLEVTGKGWQVKLTEYARGDFDGNGVEDILVRADGVRRPGTYASHRLLILTRDSTKGRLRTVREVAP